MYFITAFYKIPLKVFQTYVLFGKKLDSLVHTENLKQKKGEKFLYPELNETQNMIKNGSFDWSKSPR